MGIYIHPGNSGFAESSTVSIPNEEIRLEFQRVVHDMSQEETRRRLRKAPLTRS